MRRSARGSGVAARRCPPRSTGGGKRDRGSARDMLAAVKRSNPAISEDGAISFVADSIVYYCPQYEGE